MMKMKLMTESTGSRRNLKNPTLLFFILVFPERRGFKPTAKGRYRLNERSGNRAGILAFEVAVRPWKLCWRFIGPSVC